MAFTSPQTVIGRSFFGLGAPFLKFYDECGMVHTITLISKLHRDGNTVELELPNGENIKMTAPTQAEAVSLEGALREYFPIP